MTFSVSFFHVIKVIPCPIKIWNISISIKYLNSKINIANNLTCFSLFFPMIASAES